MRSTDQGSCRGRRCLQGVLGKDPGFDPLAFLLRHAHARGIQVHAWLNPYRVSTDISQATLEMLSTAASDSPPSVYVQHPEWVGVAADRLVLDPGIPAIRRWICAVVAELIVHYDVDGVQFDDYFYSETAQSPLDDAQTYARQGAGFADKGDWRRDNTYRLIRDVGTTIRRSGQAWRSVSVRQVYGAIGRTTLGDRTRRQARLRSMSPMPTPDAGCAKSSSITSSRRSRPFARQIVRYDVIARWWADTVGTGRVQLYIGMALYKVGTSSALEPDWTVAGGVPSSPASWISMLTCRRYAAACCFAMDFSPSPRPQQVVDYLTLRWQGD